MQERRDLGRALARKDLTLRYQPIVDPRDGQAVSAEALLRGRSDDRREWNVAELTEGAELSTDIFELDQWIMEQACRDAARWQNGRLPRLKLNLNLSAMELRNPDFLPAIDRIVRDENIDPALINLEITETASILDPALADSVVHKLQQRGYHIWLDDFGTGHSSLEWLKWFDVEGLKIPRSFVGDLMTDRRSESIVRSVCRLAEELDSLVAAEGVESREQLIKLLELGINLAQGYLFHRPLSADELETTLTGN